MKSMIATALVVLAVSTAGLIVRPVSVGAQQPMGNAMSTEQMQMMHNQNGAGQPDPGHHHAHDAGPRCLWRYPRDCPYLGG